MRYNKKASFRPKYRTPSTFRIVKGFEVRKNKVNLKNYEKHQTNREK